MTAIDPDLYQAMFLEAQRQQNEIELIASENIVSRAVMEAQGSILTNKYAEGYPGKRYYGGCQYVDIVENIAIDRAKELFGSKFANVQPHSGSQANQAVFQALLSPGDTILGMSLDGGGHLTHGAKPNQSGKWFNSIQYGLDGSGFVDMDQVRKLAIQHNPKMIIAGFSAYSRVLDFADFRKIADEVGSYLLVDMAHVAGLVAAGVYPSPIPYAHVVTTTTHKTLRGPRGGMILTNDEVISKKINCAIFPGIQGGPLMHVIAAKAVAFHEALQPDFKVYAEQVVTNAKVLARQLMDGGLNIVTGGTDNHLMLVDLRSTGIDGKTAEIALGRAFITTNKNAVPNDPNPPTITSGIRVGTPAATSRGFGEKEFTEVAHLMLDVLRGVQYNDPTVEEKVKAGVLKLTSKFPLE
jgi:glycine hydroxymethyltransferase